MFEKTRGSSKIAPFCCSGFLDFRYAQLQIVPFRLLQGGFGEGEGKKERSHGWVLVFCVGGLMVGHAGYLSTYITAEKPAGGG